MTTIIVSTSTEGQIETLIQEIGRLFDREVNLEILEKSPDIHHLMPEGKSIGIEDVKKLQAKMIYQPFGEKFQVAIIYKGELLTIEAQNAMLKTLEEQGDRTAYFLLVNNEKNLLPTIISRGQKIYAGESEAEKLSDKSFVASRPEILDMPLHEQFAFIEKVSKADKEEPGAIKNLLKDLAQYFRDRLTTTVEAGDQEKTIAVNKVLESIQMANVRIAANVNNKIALEVIMLEANKIAE